MILSGRSHEVSTVQLFPIGVSSDRRVHCASSAFQCTHVKVHIAASVDAICVWIVVIFEVGVNEITTSAVMTADIALQHEGTEGIMKKCLNMLVSIIAPLQLDVS